MMASASTFSPRVHRFDSLDSTNRKARELAQEGAGPGTVVWTDYQTQGRGRGSHTWHSPPGGLYCSVLLNSAPSRPGTDLSLLTGVAVTQAVRELLPKSMEVTVKWPNDCLLNWKKVAGVLVESLGDSGSGMCVVGVGINVNLPPEELLAFERQPFGATSFQAECGGTFELEASLNMLLSKLFVLYHLYHRDGIRPVRYLWERNCAFVGKQVELSETGRRMSEASRQSTRGTFVGLDDNGAIILANGRGDRRSYYSGVITCCWR